MRFLFIFFYTITFAQQSQKVDFKTVHATLLPNSIEKSISGEVNYEFEVLSSIDTIAIDAIRMDFSNIKINGKSVNFKNTTKALQLFEGFKKGKNTLTFYYKANPKQTLYFIGEGENLQIWTQGQGKYTSHWLPSFDDVNEKVVFNLSIEFDSSFEVLSNGKLDGTTIYPPQSNPNKIWHYQMKKPMSSYLVMMAIGKFTKQTAKTKSGTPLELYLDQKDANKFETTYKYTTQIFDFFEQEIGVKYPWGIYRQVPVRDFLYSGMENTTSTIFSQDFVVNEIGFNDKTYINVNAHELAHQWFGNLITAETGKHHWLQEGFATYYALLAEKELFGDDYFQWELYEMAERLQQASKTDTIPLLNEKASSLTFYQKGAWALHYLRENIGPENFQKAVKNYLKKYGFKNVNTTNFLKEVNAVSNFNTTTFQQNWLEKPGFEVNQALDLLKKNSFMKLYLNLVQQQSKPFEEKKELFETILKSDDFYPIKEEVIFQLAEIPFEEKEQLLNLSLASKSIKVRQAVSRIMVEIPRNFQSEYETLLNDDSYITKEIALGTLWRLFPERQEHYLNLSKDWIGFNDKNLRILWLTLALLSEGYEVLNKVKFYDELFDFSSSKYESSIRQNALTNLLYLNPNDQNILRNLVNATTHHKWQFTLFARNQIRELIKTERHKKFFQEMLPTLSSAEQNQLNRLLEN
ncbi:M1 family peptidase [Flavobacterium piscinae]|uniref:Aminopeptidase N n=1 Tax=Flavobacterium piscinae TaxID=2506424 RepID=A0A4V1N4H8_9FLAO|nr:M1 family metallopeptidase [Flavobacterium piscinae]RXR32216.1 M1 family peptidase [Flavobacterium piscinae]